MRVQALGGAGSNPSVEINEIEVVKSRCRWPVLAGAGSNPSVEISEIEVVKSRCRWPGEWSVDGRRSFEVNFVAASVVVVGWARCRNKAGKWGRARLRAFPMSWLIH